MELRKIVEIDHEIVDSNCIQALKEQYFQLENDLFEVHRADPNELVEDSENEQDIDVMAEMLKSQEDEILELVKSIKNVLQYNMKQEDYKNFFKPNS